jgi:hypothetical protein
VPRVGKGVHGALRVLRVPPDLTVGIDMGELSHIMRERGEGINGGHERTVSPVIVRPAGAQRLRWSASCEVPGAPELRRGGAVVPGSGTSTTGYASAAAAVFTVKLHLGSSIHSEAASRRCACG